MEPLRVLEEVKRLALEQLGGLPAMVFRGVEQSLNNAVPNGMAGPGHFEDLGSLRLLRQQNATLAMRFRQQLGQGFDDFRGLRVRNRGELPLGLIDDEQLEFQLQGQRLSEALQGRYQRPLEMLRGRLTTLSAALGTTCEMNPIGPDRLAAAFVETFREAEPSASVRSLMFRQYEQDLAMLLGDFYGRINTLLASAGYGVASPEPHHATRPSQPFVADTVEPRQPQAQPQTQSRPQPQPQAHADPGAFSVPGLESVPGREQPQAPSPAAPASPGELREHVAQELADLRALLQTWREGLRQQGVGSTTPGHASAPAAAAAAAAKREMRVEEMLSVASMMQHEPPDAFARALAGSGRLADTIRDHLSDGARRIGINPDQTRFSAQEEDAIDLVALLFDSLFRNHSLQDRARRLYARLVLPYVKVALTDESVFVAHDHPARKLLDAITEACEGNQATTPQDRELLDRAAAASQRVVAEYNEDMAVFELAHAELDALLNQQRRRVDLQEQRAVKASMGRERLGSARAAADSAVGDRLRGQRMTRAVADFLAEPWRHHVIQTVLREGDEPSRQAEAFNLGDALLEADRLAAEHRGKELADHLLGLEPAIVQCLASSGLDDSAARHALAGLVHALATPDRPRNVQAQPVRTGEAEDEGSEERRVWLSGAAGAGEPDPALVASLAGLAIGDWVRLTDTQGEVVPAKVAWVSPLTARLLLVNRRGVRVLAATARELAVLAGAGRLVTGTESTAFDEAMRQVRHRLDKAVGQH
ncbi:DUF1631 family protein [Lysobacter sp. A3-1-A15]